ncbi:MAG: hypothetical protein EP330_20495 [Deltaproteobacteria bacterium]|nr:MAG: hypothetical protein EP330_20495 [Deltaproteobacteria bacterium]
MLTLALVANLAFAEPLPTRSDDGRYLPDPRGGVTRDAVPISRTLEERFVRANRQAGYGLLAFGMGSVATGAGVVMAATAFRFPALVAGGALLAATGGTAMIVSPFVVTSGVLRAAGQLRQAGYKAPIGLAGVGLGLMALTPLSLGLSLPVGLVLVAGQSLVNRQSFITATGRPPRMPIRQLGVVPMPVKGGAGLALAASW